VLQKVRIMAILGKKTVASTPLSEFIRNAPSREKKKVYATVLKRAAEMQHEVIVRVEKARRATG
jgi:hypothetical protein